MECGTPNNRATQSTPRGMRNFPPILQNPAPRRPTVNIQMIGTDNQEGSRRGASVSPAQSVYSPVTGKRKSRREGRVGAKVRADQASGLVSSPLPTLFSRSLISFSPPRKATSLLAPHSPCGHALCRVPADLPVRGLECV